MTVGNIDTSARAEWVTELKQYCSKSRHHRLHEAVKLSAGKLKLMCSMGSDRRAELLCQRAHRGQ